VLLKEHAAGITVTQVLEDLIRKTDNPDRRGLFPGIGKK
jgi:hypothetical protein